MSQKLSLINPDLTGLYSVGRLGNEKKWWSKIAGTIVLSAFLYSWVGGFIVPLFIINLFIMKYYTVAIILLCIITLPYFIPVTPQPWLCRIYMKYGAHYFAGGSSLSYEGAPSVRDPTIPVCAAIHPHGLMCISYFLCCGIRYRSIQDIKDKKIRRQFAGVLSDRDDYVKRWPYKGIIIGYLAKAPLFNFVISKLTGCVASSSSKSMKAMMRKGESFGILPGGFNEATAFRKGDNVIYIKDRKGFIKYCLQFGYETTPAYLFGECETYNNLFYSHTDKQWIINIKYWLNQWKIPTVFPIGQYWFSPFLPCSNIGVHAIFSKNSKCQKIDNPTQKDIDEFHKWYIGEINALFERNKWRFGYDEDVKLRII